MSSWEFYQQPEDGTPAVAYPLWWVCGCAAAPYGLPQFLASPNAVWAVPFDQMRAVTVSKMIINLNLQGGANAAVRLAIYQNSSSTNNAPKNLIVDAGEIDVSGAAGLGPKVLAVNANLAANTRYWAVLWTNSVGGSQLSGLSPDQIIHWGAYSHGLLAPGFRPVAGLASGMPYTGIFPNPFWAVDWTWLNYGGQIMPAIALAFSSVT